MISPFINLFELKILILFANNLEKFLINNLKDIKKRWPKKLPSGIIHGDLFIDNIFFKKNKLSGIIDFYFAANDYFMYEIAICINALCFDNKKSKFKINYRVSGESFLTKPNKTTYMIQNIIKKITKIKPKLSTTGGTSDLRFIKAISPGLEFGLVGKTMHKVDEAVSLKDLKNLKKIYQNILHNYFN